MYRSGAQRTGDNTQAEASAGTIGQPSGEEEVQVEVTTSPKARPPWMLRGVDGLVGALIFIAPLLALLLVWAIVVPLFQINPRVFPSVGAVGAAAMESISDGTLVRHVGASLLRVGLGTLIGVVSAVPLGIAMGVNSAVSAFLTPLLRFFSVLAGIAWIPIATLWFGYGFGAIVFVLSLIHI